MQPELHEATRLWTLAVPTVSAFLTSIVREFQDRDDLLQETAVAVMESHSRYDRSQSFIPWAIGIARNQVRLYYRRQGRNRLVFDDETIDALARGFESTDRQDDRMEYLDECMERLESRSRELCRLRYQQDLKPAEISRRLNLTANTVAKSLQRIRDQLRECIDRKQREAYR